MIVVSMFSLTNIQWYMQDMLMLTERAVKDFLQAIFRSRSILKVAYLTDCSLWCFGQQI